MALALLGGGASLRARLMALSVAALMPGFCVIGVTEYQVNRSRQAEVRDLAVRSARQAAFELDRMVSGVQAVLIAVSEVTSIRDLNDDACSTYLHALGPRLTNLTSLSVLDLAGRLRCGSVANPAENNFGDRAYFRDALASPGVIVGEYTAGRLTKRAVLPIALALRDAKGQASGVLVASMDLAWLGEELRKRGLPPDGSLTVADRHGVILARQPLAEQFVGTEIPEMYRRLVDAAEAGSETVISRDGTRRILGYVPVSQPPVGLCVSVGLSAEVSYAAVARAARVGALLAAGAGLATLAATWIVGSRAFVRPVRRLARVLGRWRQGDRTARTGFRDGSGEIGALGAALDGMMDEIAASQEQRDLLAGELAHRVKNTLATVQAIATATLSKPAPAEDLLPDFLARIAALARTHEILTRDRWEGADLQDLAVRVLQPLCGDVDARFRIGGPKVELAPAEALGMTMVLHELCTNAMKYGALSQPSGQIDLTWSVAEEERGTAVALAWQERDGPPVSPPFGKGGFGTRLIARAFPTARATTVDFDPAGVTYRTELLIETPAAAMS